jgi:hypothetical protein
MTSHVVNLLICIAYWAGCIYVGHYARDKKNRDGVVWAVLSLLATPLIAMYVLKRRKEIET